MKLLFAFVMTLGFALPTSATLISVNSTDYDVQWAIGTFEDVNDTYNLTSQLWWEDFDTALDFTQALGFLDDGDPWTAIGPGFAYEQTGDIVTLVGAQDSIVAPYSRFTLDTALNPDYEQAWAYISTVVDRPIPEPGSVGLLALGIAGLLAGRRARR